MKPPSSSVKATAGEATKMPQEGSDSTTFQAAEALAPMERTSSYCYSFVEAPLAPSRDAPRKEDLQKKEKEFPVPLKGPVGMESSEAVVDSLKQSVQLVGLELDRLQQSADSSRHSGDEKGKPHST